VYSILYVIVLFKKKDLKEKFSELQFLENMEKLRALRWSEVYNSSVCWHYFYLAFVYKITGKSIYRNGIYG
jgi:hypothetical protein